MIQVKLSDYEQSSLKNIAIPIAIGVAINIRNKCTKHSSYNWN